MIIRSMFFFLIITAIISCSGNTEQRSDEPINHATVIEENTRPSFNAGELISRINCPGDPQLSFALYLPLGYSNSKKHPVMILFDPQGDGSLPLKKYKKLADHYGYVMMGSNDSRNGNLREQTAHILEEMMRSVRTVVNPDSLRIYAAGFSGGARVASLLGLSPSGIQGFAVCGAGFPVESWYSVPPSVIVALSGNSDMNLSELEKIKPREEFKGRFQLIRYNGKHEWPPEELFENVFMAFESYAMRDKIRETDKELLLHIDTRFRQQAAQLNVSGRLIEGKLLYEAWIKNLGGQFETAEIEKTYHELTRRPQYSLYSRNEVKMLEEEIRLRNFYTEAIGSKDTSWWRSNMGKLHQEIRDTKERLNAEMLERVKGYMSLAIYTTLNRAVSASKGPLYLDYLTAIYRITDPENPESWYVSAVHAATQQKNAEALNYLHLAVENGFTDLRRIQSEPGFSGISGSSGFEKVLNAIRQHTNGTG
jgi:hypothetical protein